MFRDLFEIWMTMPGHKLVFFVEEIQQDFIQVLRGGLNFYKLWEWVFIFEVETVFKRNFSFGGVSIANEQASEFSWWDFLFYFSNRIYEEILLKKKFKKVFSQFFLFFERPKFFLELNKKISSEKKESFESNLKELGKVSK